MRWVNDSISNRISPCKQRRLVLFELCYDKDKTMKHKKIAIFFLFVSLIRTLYAPLAVVYSINEVNDAETTELTATVESVKSRNGYFYNSYAIQTVEYESSLVFEADEYMLAFVLSPSEAEGQSITFRVLTDSRVSLTDGKSTRVFSVLISEKNLFTLESYNRFAHNEVIRKNTNVLIGAIRDSVIVAVCSYRLFVSHKAGMRKSKASEYVQKSHLEIPLVSVSKYRSDYLSNAKNLVITHRVLRSPVLIVLVLSYVLKSAYVILSLIKPDIFWYSAMMKVYFVELLLVLVAMLFIYVYHMQLLIKSLGNKTISKKEETVVTKTIITDSCVELHHCNSKAIYHYAYSDIVKVVTSSEGLHLITYCNYVINIYDDSFANGTYNDLVSLLRFTELI